MHHESHARSIVKTVSWKVVASILAFGITYFFTGSIETAGKSAFILTVFGFIAYYGHERIWNGIHWGKAELP